MYFNIVAISLSMALTVFLAVYTARSLILFFVARNIVKSFSSNICQEQSEVAMSKDNFRKSAITFLDNYYDIGTHTDLDMQSKTGSYTSLDRQFKKTDYEPFISILIATYNEQKVINCLMNSCAALTYNQNKFEIIVIDDSEDETFHILKIWEKKIQNLKVIHRNNRTGWKGGALNVAINNMYAKSSYALIVDADNVLASHILENFVSCFNRCNPKENIKVLQGYSVPIVYYDYSENSIPYTCDQAIGKPNWISNAINIRLAKRNMIEFVAKDNLSLPIQITGSLFMIRSEVIKLVGFSEDLAEDWDLTLNLYCYPNRILPHMYNHKNRQQDSNIGTRKVLYCPSLRSYSGTITKFNAYFRQRMRVSEGHTRGFRKNIFNILISKIRIRDKIELILTGLQYSRYIAAVALIIIDSILLSSNGINFVISDDFMKMSLSVQATILLITIGICFMALDVCATIQSYNVRDVLYLLLLNLCTVPAFVIGSLYGFFKDQGIFYRTEKSND
jgi:cellulose synthase/poly-beta-1,6-N-acetylglucosamine synthase-like glycosyltransferase